jgi:hypothetical protein
MCSTTGSLAKGGVMTYVVLAVIFVILVGALFMMRRRRST